MNILIAGGSGFIGRKLISALLEKKFKVTLLTRQPDKIRISQPNITIEFWTTKITDEFVKLISRTDVIINLAGESIASKRWSNEQKQKILESRINTTRSIVTAIEQSHKRPTVLLNASAVGYYGNTNEDEITELSPKGNGFLADVCEQWENEALKVKHFGVRVVLLRTGIVLGKDGGVLQRLIPAFRFFIGGPLGSGKQWIPWIHIEDEVNAIIFAMMNTNINGPINLCAPEPTRMEDFCRLMGKALHRPSWLKLPSTLLKLLYGEMANELLLQSQKVVPKKLLNSGFKFRSPNLETGLKDILKDIKKYF